MSEPSTSSDRHDRWLWTVAVTTFVWLLAVALRAFSFQYVEGDDAATTSFHALGRNELIQPPYATYQSGTDAVLGFLPTDEPTIRTTAMVASLVATGAFVVSSLHLARSWRREDGVGSGSDPMAGLLAVATVILAIPELSYIGLSFQPTLAALCTLTIAHAVLRSAIDPDGEVPVLRLLTSAALFGVGVSLRWDAGVYGLVVAADLALLAAHRIRVSAFVRWVLVAIICFSAMSALGGAGPGDVGEIVGIGLDGDGRAEGRPLLLRVANLASVATPAVFILGLFGLCAMNTGRRRAALAFLAIGAVQFGVFELMSPKLYVWLLPVLVHMILTGLDGTGAVIRRHRRAGAGLVVGLVGLLIAPWVIGLEVRDHDTAWGPGFEVQPFDRTESGRSSTVRLTLGSGSAFPTPEGPRAIGGHLDALLGGDRRALIEDLAAHRRRSMQTALDLAIPFIIAEGSDGYVTAELSRRGFEPEGPYVEREGYRRRYFSDGERRLLVVKLDELGFLLERGRLAAIASENGADSMVIGAYPSGMRALHEAGLELEAIGPMNGLAAIPGRDLR